MDATPVDIALAESDELKIYKVEDMILYPKRWSQFECPVELFWECVQFSKETEEEIPDDFGGVYTFVVQPGIANHPCVSYLLYVGQTTKQTFRERYGQYIKKKTSKELVSLEIVNMLRKYEGYLWFCYAKIDDIDIIISVEKALQNSYIPPANTQFWGEIGPARRGML